MPSEFRVLETLRIFGEWGGKAADFRQLEVSATRSRRKDAIVAAISDRRASIVEHGSTLQDPIGGRRQYVTATIADAQEQAYDAPTNG